MQIRTLYSLLKLYEVQNVSKASEQLFLTQQGLSRQIKSLEQEFGVPLFVRKKDGVIPTELCCQLIPQIRTICEAHTAALRILEKAPGAGLRIGFPYGLANGIGNQFLVEYLNAYPQISIELQEARMEACQEGLASGRLDLAIFIEPFDKADLLYEPIAADQMYAAIHRSNPLAAEPGPLPFAQLDGQKIITSPQENVLVRFFDYCCTLAHIQVQRLMFSSYAVDFLNSMSRDIGIEPLTSAMAFRITNPELRIRRLILPVPGQIYLCRAKNGPHQKEARHFAAFCKDYFAREPVPRFGAEEG